MARKSLGTRKRIFNGKKFTAVKDTPAHGITDSDASRIKRNWHYNGWLARTTKEKGGTMFWVRKNRG